jgi:hypothetical protein
MSNVVNCPNWLITGIGPLEAVNLSQTPPLVCWPVYGHCLEIIPIAIEDEMDKKNPQHKVPNTIQELLKLRKKGEPRRSLSSGDRSREDELQEEQDERLKNFELARESSRTEKLSLEMTKQDLDLLDRLVSTEHKSESPEDLIRAIVWDTLDNIDWDDLAEA